MIHSSVISCRDYNQGSHYAYQLPEEPYYDQNEHLPSDVYQRAPEYPGNYSRRQAQAHPGEYYQAPARYPITHGASAQAQAPPGVAQRAPADVDMPPAQSASTYGPPAQPVELHSLHVQDHREGYQGSNTHVSRASCDTPTSLHVADESAAADQEQLYEYHSRPVDR